jgi:hypothetical protein
MRLRKATKDTKTMRAWVSFVSLGCFIGRLR